MNYYIILNILITIILVTILIKNQTNVKIKWGTIVSIFMVEIIIDILLDFLEMYGEKLGEIMFVSAVYAIGSNILHIVCCVLLCKCICGNKTEIIKKWKYRILLVTGISIATVLSGILECVMKYLNYQRMQIMLEATKNGTLGYFDIFTSGTYNSPITYIQMLISVAIITGCMSIWIIPILKAKEEEERE